MMMMKKKKKKELPSCTGFSSEMGFYRVSWWVELGFFFYRVSMRLQKGRVIKCAIINGRPGRFQVSLAAGRCLCFVFFCVFSFVLPSFLLVCLFFFGVRLLPLRSFVLRTFDPGFLLGSTACSKRPLEERNLFRLF